MNSSRKDTLFFLLFLLIVGGIVYGENVYLEEMKTLKGEIRTLRTQSMRLEQQAREQLKQIDVYKKAIARLEQYQLGIPENEVDFYAWVQQELTKNGVRSNVVKPANAPPAGRSGVQIDFEGPYYEFVRTLADWRNLKVAVRVSSVNLSAVDGENAKGVAIIQSVLKKK